MKTTTGWKRAVESWARKYGVRYPGPNGSMVVWVATGDGGGYWMKVKK